MGQSIQVLKAQTVTPSYNSRVVLGYSVENREIVAKSYGSVNGVPVLIVGSIHGNEKSGLQVSQAAALSVVPQGYTLWVIDTLNPDGTARNMRHNANGVDLNRNFPSNWLALPCPSKNCSGAKAASEPEVLAFMGFLNSVKPVVVVFYHATANIVDYIPTTTSNAQLVARYAKFAKVRLGVMSCGKWPCSGTATSYVHALGISATAFVVELPCDRMCLSTKMVNRHVSALYAALPKSP